MELKIYSLYPTDGKDKVQEKRRRRLSLFLSLIFHLGVLLLSLKFFRPMGELFKEEQVRAVFLADREKLLIPEYLVRPERLGSWGALPENQKTAGDEATVVGSRDFPPVTGEEIEQYLASLHSRAIPSEPVKLRIDPDFLERFQLAPPDANTFLLSVSPKTQNETEEKWKEPAAAMTREDFLVPFAAGTDAGLKKLLASSVSAGRYPASGDHTTEVGARFDIQSWAEKALARIENNWMPDPVLSQNLKGIVGISVTISRSGEIQSVEIVKSSGYAGFDQIALNALKASNPLPSLSEDFPGQTLALYFEFEYEN